MRKNVRIISLMLVISLVLSGIDMSALYVNAGNGEDRTVDSPVIGDTKTVWNTVYFGNYWQNDTNGDGVADKNDDKEPIRWRVLEVEGDDMMLLAENVLDVMPYDYLYYEDVYWDNSSIRSWLNGLGASENRDKYDFTDYNFIDEAFTASEKKDILVTEVTCTDTDDGTNGVSKDTEDRVYLPSNSEMSDVDYGFFSIESMSDTSRAASFTVFANDILSEITTESMETYYWLRSINECPDVVSGSGYINHNDYYGHYMGTIGIRPIIHIKKSSDLWSKAEDITLEKNNIVFYLCDGTNNSITRYYSENDYLGEMPEPECDGKMFVGWFTEKEGGKQVYPGNIVKNVPKSFYAHWDDVVSVTLHNPVVIENTVTYDTVYFGHRQLYQEDPDVLGVTYKSPVKWRVLSVSGNDAFLMSD